MYFVIGVNIEECSECLFCLQLVVELYEILVNVDKTCDHLRYLDPITDFLYPLTIWSLEPLNVNSRISTHKCASD